MRKSFTKILLLTMAVLFAMPGNAEAAPQRQSALLESSGTGEVVDDHGITVGIDAVAAGGRPVDVYSLDGKLLRRQTTTLDGLKGIYIVDGKTVMIRR